MCSFRHTWPALPQDAGQRRLAHLDRLPPKVRAVQLQQVKGAKEGRRLVPAMAKHLEGSHALLIAAHLFTVDVGLDRQPAAESSHHRLGRCKAWGGPTFMERRMNRQV